MQRTPLFSKRRARRAHADTGSFSVKSNLAPVVVAVVATFLVVRDSGDLDVSEVVIPAVAGIGALIGSYLIHFIWNVWRAGDRLLLDDTKVALSIAEKERDEPMTELAKIAKLFSIEWNGEAFFVKHSDSGKTAPGVRPEHDDDRLVIEGTLMFGLVHSVLVESIHLGIDGNRFDTDWSPDRIYQQGFGYAISVECPISIQRGQRTARIHAIVDGERYTGERFTIILPTRLSQGKQPDRSN